MRFLIDENLPGDLVGAAQESQHEARWSRDFAPAASDSMLLAVLEQTGEILVTRDVRFANLVLGLMASGVSLSGAVLIREDSVKAVRVAWRSFLVRGTEVKGLVVLTRDKIRIRRLAGL